ncbi:MAG: LURP-one-related family protein [Anaerolineae bacterium]|nr:LURP-one-related family protein [Anaerolineae bacterium]
MRYVMKQKVVTLRDRFAIYDEHGDRIYQAKGKLVSVGDKLTLRSTGGKKLASIRQKVVSLIPRYHIRRGGKLQAVIKKRAFTAIKDKFKVTMRDGSPDLQITGNMLDHEYTVWRKGKKVAKITKKWVAFGDSYGIEVQDGQDDILILCCAVIVDMICHRGAHPQLADE